MTLPVFVFAALAEIAGCFAFWHVVRSSGHPLWLAAGMMSLAAFAAALTQVEADAAGRAFAAYGGIYIVASLGWMWAVEGMRPDRWDVAGGLICLAGACVILFAPRG
ncbi:UPF0060 membrane protein [Azorhizobium oxalatiphilum]|uniref:UPF0060 membrane protein n=1 Tax=Azorhizobium oxalatiphilum TaxID=980631 RepID=A0A917CHU5_9HYPH|nr:YnfA family protein [Azorhizobium oxalatiphilum]GGF89003.1 UPF0060 membrane protein [Azorhizobium oxalatiphilum]